MLIPVVAYTDDGVAYGIGIPDTPGCFTAEDTLQESQNNVRDEHGNTL